MKKMIKVIAGSYVCLLICSCTAFSQKPTIMPTPTLIDTPTVTMTPPPTATATVEPTSTSAAPTATEQRIELLRPQGTPSTNWEGIPVMPNAIAGESDNSSYSYILQGTPNDVQTFYERTMTQMGWDLFATGESPTGALMILFMKDTEMITVSVIPQSDGLLYVMLVK